MTTDDRDIESSNPSKSFKVGDFDRLSGFFTPVWESKRKLRSESPIPSSSAAASAPTSSRGSAAAKAPATPAAATPAAPATPAALPQSGSEPPAQARPAQGASAEPTPAGAPRARGTGPLTAKSRTGSAMPDAAQASPAAASPAAVQLPAASLASKASADPSVEAQTAARVSPPLQAGSKARELGSQQAWGASAQPAANVTLTGVASPDLQARAVAAAQSAKPKEPPVVSEAAPSTPNASVTVRPVIPMPSPSPRLSGRPKASGPPSAASAALKEAGPQLASEAYLDQEPEFRPPLAAASPAAKSPAAKSPAAKSPAAAPPAPIPSGPGSPPRAERPKVNHRSLRASVAATAIHEKLRAKLQTDSAETLARHRETDSDREAIQAVAARAVATPTETYPLHLLRRLRRTIHLSTPLPESVRAMLSKYRG